MRKPHKPGYELRQKVKLATKQIYREIEQATKVDIENDLRAIWVEVDGKEHFQGICHGSFVLGCPKCLAELKRRLGL